MLWKKTLTYDSQFNKQKLIIHYKYKKKSKYFDTSYLSFYLTEKLFECNQN